MIPFLAFDIEIADDLPEERPWQEVAPLGITCAATYSNRGISHVFHGAEQEDGRLAPRMTKDGCMALLTHLIGATSVGIPIVGWNSLGFDLQVLGYETGAWSEIRYLAQYDHIDPAFQMLCERGYMVGLNTACKGMKVEQKLEGVEGAQAPAMWRGTREDQDKVLAYVQQDAKITGLLYKAVVEAKALYWRTKRGSISSWAPTMKAERMLLVDEAAILPSPDTSWMTNPRPRSKYSGWLEKEA